MNKKMTVEEFVEKWSLLSEAEYDEKTHFANCSDIKSDLRKVIENLIGEDDGYESVLSLYSKACRNQLRAEIRKNIEDGLK